MTYVSFFFFWGGGGISDFVGNSKHTQKLQVKTIQSLATQIDVQKCFLEVGGCTFIDIGLRHQSHFKCVVHAEEKSIE